MEHLTVLIGTAMPILMAWIGSIEWRLRTMANEFKNIPTRNEVAEQIMVRQEAVKQAQKDLQEDVRRLETKIDKLLEFQRS
jgi:hypothetical protein